MHFAPNPRKTKKKSQISYIDSKRTFAFFGRFAIFFALARPISKNFGLKTDNLFYEAYSKSASHGAQMLLFSYSMVHKCLWGGADKQTGPHVQCWKFLPRGEWPPPRDCAPWCTIPKSGVQCTPWCTNALVFLSGQVVHNASEEIQTERQTHDVKTITPDTLFFTLNYINY